MLNREGGWQTIYTHLRQGSVPVRKGDQVLAGQSLGNIGLSGLTEFPHVHFGVKYYGADNDPFTGKEASVCGLEAGPLFDNELLENELLENELWNRENNLQYESSQILDMGLSALKPVSS